MSRILLVEDEAGIRMTIKDRLRAEGYETEAVEDGLAGYEKACGGGIDLIILDLMIPKKDGLEVCRDLRSQAVATPVLMLTAKGQLMDKVTGLKTGADDYLTKPFEMLELLARVDAILRRSQDWLKPDTPHVIKFGDILIDAKQKLVFRGGKPLVLSAKEFQLLQYLVLHPLETLSRDVLLRDVWNYDAKLTTRTVDVHVGWLRQKIESNPKKPHWICTQHGLGYKFVPEEQLTDTA